MLLVLGRDAEQLLDDHVVYAAEMDYAEQTKADEEASLAQAPNITNPVENVVYFAFDNGQVQVHLISDRNVDIVVEFVGPFRLLAYLKDPFRI